MKDEKDEQTTQVGRECPGCHGTCHDCGGVVAESKNVGRPRIYCCHPCKTRKVGRDWYKRNVQAQARDGRYTRHHVGTVLDTEEMVAAKKLDRKEAQRAVDAHKEKGHDGKKCPGTILRSPGTCLLYATLQDQVREAMGLEPSVVQAVRTARAKRRVEAGGDWEPSWMVDDDRARGC